MAAITLANCDVVINHVGGFKLVKIVTPSSADGGDTIDVSTLFHTGCFSWVSTCRSHLEPRTGGCSVTRSPRVIFH